MGRVAVSFALFLMAMPICVGQTIGQQAFPDLPRPIKMLPGSEPRTEDISLDSVEFREPSLYRYGVGFWPIDGEPSRGAQYYIAAKLSPQEAIATAKFEAVDETGKVILPLRLVREATAPGHAEFYGIMLVPDQPFRVMASGKGVNGEGYSRVHEQLFRPTNRPPADRLRPIKGTRRSAQSSKQMIENMYRDLAAELKQKVSKYPTGVIVLPHTRVSNVTYAALLSKASRPLGVRISYDVEFSEDGYYNPELRLFLNYEREDWRGLVDMQVLDGSITPLPEEAGSPQIQPNILAYDAGYLYRGGVTYHFVADLVPDYVIRNETKTKFCLYNQKFRHSPQSEAAWQALLASKSTPKLSVYIDNTGFAGEIEGFYDQGTLYRSFVAEGAKDCGPEPTNRF